MNRYKELIVWQKSVDLSVEVYGLTEKFPKSEMYGLVSQINRCSVSIPSNIAEGAGRNSNAEFNQFLGIASGSSYEIETQVIIAQKLNYISEEKLNTLITKIEEIQKMIYKLQLTLKTK